MDGVARRQQHRGPAAALVAAVAAVTFTASPVAAAPGDAGGSEPVVGAAATADHSCNSQAVVSCLLPYPSEQFLRHDPTSPTGYRVDVPDDILPEELASQLGPGATIDAAFGHADGFSALSPVVFELPDRADPASLEADGGDAFVVVDLDTGERVPMRVELSKDAERLWAKDRIVMGFPVGRFRSGGRYLAVLTDALRAPGGAAIRRGPGLDAKRAASELDRFRARRLELQLAAGAPWIDPGRVLAATMFVTRSDANILDDLDRMAAMVRADEHPIRNVWVSPSLIGGAQLVTGQVRVTDLRDDFGAIPWGDEIVPRPHWVEFMMVMPHHPASPAGAPVAIYGHGLSVQRETMFTVAAQNAAKGIATIGIDIPNHGSRSWAEGGFLLELTTPYRFGRLASMPLQGIMDNLSLLTAVRTTFASLDVFPVQNWLTNSWGDGRPDLDTDHVLYQGTSMGAILGTSFVALAPELDGAFVQVGGTGIVDTIFHSFLWPLFSSIAPWGSTAGDSHALVGAAGMLMDRADNVYLLDRIRQAGTPFHLVYADGDTVVPRWSSERLIRGLGLPVVAPLYHPVEGVEIVDALPTSGSSASQIPTWEVGDGLLSGLVAHTWFSAPRPTAELNQWLDDRLAEMRLDPFG